MDSPHEIISTFKEKFKNFENDLYESVREERDYFESETRGLKDDIFDLNEKIDSLNKDLETTIANEEFITIRDQALRIQSYIRGEFTTFNFRQELEKLIELILTVDNY